MQRHSAEVGLHAEKLPLLAGAVSVHMAGKEQRIEVVHFPKVSGSDGVAWRVSRWRRGCVMKGRE